MIQNNPYYGMMPPYNPVVPIQQRLQQYEQAYVDPAIRNMMKCRAVTSIDEARASMIDLDGSVHVFTDLHNKKIYTKQIGLDGNAILNTYELVENTNAQTQERPKETEPIQPQVSMNDLEAIRQEFYGCLDDINMRVDGLAQLQANNTPKKQNTTKK